MKSTVVHCWKFKTRVRFHKEFIIFKLDAHRALAEDSEDDKQFTKLKF
jgi:hypothetical protein